MKDKKYVNRWWRYADLEDVIYRPLLLNILPTILGFFCRILDILVDAVVIILRNTIYRESRREMELEEGNGFTHAFGVLLNDLEILLNKTVWKKRPHKKDFEHQFALKYSAMTENMAIIGRSLSYGLILFSLGLCATLIYLLVAAIL